MCRGLVVSIALAGVLMVLGACGRAPAALRDADIDAFVPDAAIDAAPDAAPDAAIDAPIDVMTGLPDLQFETARMVGSIRIDDMATFAADSCEVMEGCVGGSGRRRLLRFATVTMNLGTADLFVGEPPPPPQSNPTFEWSACHMHHHFREFTSYELLDGSRTLITGRKQSFCLGDNERVTDGAVSNGYTCNKQGISRGYADIYDNDVACNWLDITGVPSGTYTLKIVVNPVHKLPESDETNNVFTMDVTF